MARKFYDGLVFHRVIAGFMAQTGDPKGTGAGRSDLPDIPAEFTQTPFKRGTSAWRARRPNSANSQFFICLADAPFLDGKYTVFGEVISGMDVVDKIKKGDEANNGAVTNPDKIVTLRLAARPNIRSEIMTSDRQHPDARNEQRPRGDRDDPDLAPGHVAHIKRLVSEGFYDGIVFHRVIDGFMAQTGCPKGTGTGGSKYPDIKAEFNAEPHVRGTVSMARAKPDSANSQFFICFDDASFLDRQYTAWGKVSREWRMSTRSSAASRCAIPTRSSRRR